MKFESVFKHFHSRNAFENVICEMASILSRPQCVNNKWRKLFYHPHWDDDILCPHNSCQTRQGCDQSSVQQGHPPRTVYKEQWVLMWLALHYLWYLNPLRTKFFRGNINIYLHFVSFLHIDTTQVVAILHQIRPKGPNNNIPTLVQIMAWCWPGDKPLSEPMIVSLLTHICVTRPQWVNLEHWYEF